MAKKYEPKRFPILTWVSDDGTPPDWAKLPPPKAGRGNRPDVRIRGLFAAAVAGLRARGINVSATYVNNEPLADELFRYAVQQAGGFETEGLINALPPVVSKQFAHVADPVGEAIASGFTLNSATLLEISNRIRRYLPR